MGTLPTVGDAIRRVEELGCHVTYISGHPAHTTRRETQLDTPHLYCGKCDSYILYRIYWSTIVTIFIQV